MHAANPEDTAPRLISSVSEIDFGTIEIGDSETRRLVLTNSSLDDVLITVSSTWLSEPDALAFESDFRGPRKLPAGDSLVIELRFTPIEAGHQVGALYVSHDGESNLDIYTLIGNGKLSDVTAPQIGSALPVIEPAFGKSELAGFTNVKPTSLQFGPDGRLYVTDMLGVIKVFEIERDDDNDYRVVSEESITLIRDIPNHDDDGEPNTAINKRLVTGLMVAGTATDPVVYVASSDPRIGGGPSHTETGLDTNSGVISRLTQATNGSWQKLDLVRGLSRSEENHSINGMALDVATQRLYVAAGGNTNQGAPSNNFALLPEYALSAAILEIDLGAIGESTYDLPTLDDESRPGVQDKGDPFGGNDGRNQARLVAGGPVQVYAPGFRNPYDVVLTDKGRLYTIDNGPNAGWGGPPIDEAPNGACTNAQSEPGLTNSDALHLISGRGYYGGHPNPTRANFSNTFNTSKPQSPVDEVNPVECDLRGSGSNTALTTFGYSTNGLAEYRASNFGGAMQGDLLAAGWNNSIQRLVLDESGSNLTDKDTLFANVGALPLDVTAQSDAQHFPGTIWVADFVNKEIVIFEPVDFDGMVTGVCGGTPSTDDDNDGFSNNDELSNGTNPCSAADLPADLDGDFLSDRIDTDDDGDGIADTEDPFARDPNNGRSTGLPVTYDWENDSESAGFLFNLGFSGLMNNGNSEYLDLFELENLTTGGAAGVLTIDEIPDGDPIKALNTQAYAFQFGVDVTPVSAPFTVHTRLLAPFAGADLGGHQSMGFYIGTGDQDSYIKLVTNSAGPTGDVQFAAERAGIFNEVAKVAAPVLGQAEIDLFLSVNPSAGTVRAFYRSGDNDIVEVGSATSLPRSWLEANSGLAVGIIATSFRGPVFGATWDFIRVTNDASVITGSTTPDTDNPNAIISQPATSVGTLPEGTITFTGKATDTGGSGFDVVQIAVRRTGADGKWYDFNGGFSDTPVRQQTQLSDTTISSTNWSQSVSLPAGNYRLQVIAFDGARNYSVFDRRNFVVAAPDTQAPTPSITTPATEGATLSPSLTFTGTATDTGGSGFDVVQIAIRRTGTDGKWYDFNGGFSDTPVRQQTQLSDTTISSTNWSQSVSLPAGNYRLQVIAFDGARNYSVFDRRNFVVAAPDTQAPTPSITTPATEGATLSPSLTFTGTATDTGGSGFDVVQIAVRRTGTDGKWYDFNGGFSDTPVRQQTQLSDTTISSTNWSQSVSLPAGNYRLQVIAFDGARNYSVFDRRNFVVQ